MLVFAAVTVGTLRDRLSSDSNPIDDLHEQYAAAEIDERARQIAFHVDDRNEKIRTVVEDVAGISRWSVDPRGA